MENTAMIPVDNNGNMLFVKNFTRKDDRFFVDFKSTYNSIGFTNREIYLADEGKNFVICGDDGTVLYRFSAAWINHANLKSE